MKSLIIDSRVELTSVKHQCAKLEEKYYFFEYDETSIENIEKSIYERECGNVCEKSCENVCEKSCEKSCENVCEKSLDDGVYTWLITSDSFLFTKVHSNQEIGTTHNNLLRYYLRRNTENTEKKIEKKIEKIEILGAGEFEKSEKFEKQKIQFNLASGSYMQNYLEDIEERNVVENCIAEYFKTFFKNYFKNYELTFVPDATHSMIDKLSLTYESLNYYHQNNIVIKVFDTFEECRAESKRLILQVKEDVQYEIALRIHKRYPGKSMPELKIIPEPKSVPYVPFAC